MTITSTIVWIPVLTSCAGVVPLVHLCTTTGHSFMTSLPLIALSIGGVTSVFVNTISILFQHSEIHEVTLSLVSRCDTFIVASFLNCVVISEMHRNLHDLSNSLLQLICFIICVTLSFLSPFLLFFIGSLYSIDAWQILHSITNLQIQDTVHTDRVKMKLADGNPEMNDDSLLPVLFCDVIYYLPVFTMLAILFFRWKNRKSEIECCSLCSENREFVWFSCAYLAVMICVVSPLMLLYQWKAKHTYLDGMPTMYLILPIFLAVGFTYLPIKKDSHTEYSNKRTIT